MLRQFIMRATVVRRFGTVADSPYEAVVSKVATGRHEVDEKTLLLLKKAQERSPSFVLNRQAQQMSKKEWEEFSTQSAALRKRSSVY